MKKILVVQGGGCPNGNTSQLVMSFVKGAEEAGHEVQVVSLLKSRKFLFKWERNLWLFFFAYKKFEFSIQKKWGGCGICNL